MIGHRNEVAIAIKTTSKLERYGEKPHLTKGVVFMPAGPEPFTEPTIVDPSSAFGIPHKDIRLEMEQGRVKVWTTQDGFPCKMCAAIDENATLNKERKLNLKAILGC